MEENTPKFMCEKIHNKYLGKNGMFNDSMWENQHINIHQYTLKIE